MLEEKTVELAPFHAMDIATGIRAIVSGGARQSVRIEASRKRLLSRVKLTVVDGQLRARHNGDILSAILSGGLFNFSRLARGATLHITLPALTAVSAATGASVEVGTMTGQKITATVSTAASITVSAAKSESLQASASSSGRLCLAGACDSATLTASTGGQVNAVELSCTELHIEASSGGIIEATATTRADGQVSSGSNVTLYGRPQVVEIKTASSGMLSVN